MYILNNRIFFFSICFGEFLLITTNELFEYPFVVGGTFFPVFGEYFWYDASYSAGTVQSFWNSKAFRNKNAQMKLIWWMDCHLCFYMGHLCQLQIFFFPAIWKLTCYQPYSTFCHPTHQLAGFQSLLHFWVFDRRIVFWLASAFWKEFSPYYWGNLQSICKGSSTSTRMWPTSPWEHSKVW